MMADKTRHPVRQKYDDALKPIKIELRNYWANRAFLEGHQWTYFSRVTDSIEPVLEDQDHSQPTINRLWPGSRTIIGKLLSRELTFEVPPNGADDRAIQGSKIGESILEAVRVEHLWEAMREKLAWATWLGGTAALCVDWDPDAGKPVALSEEGTSLPEGDTVEYALALPEFVVEGGVQNVRQARWWIRAQALPVGKVKEMYKLEKTPAADASYGLSSLQSHLMSGMAGVASGTPLTLVLSYYERPNADTPKGKVVTVIGDQAVDGPKDWPFPFKDKLNLFLAYETPVGDQWYGRTVMSVARPVQSAYNVAWGAIMDHLDNVSNVRMAVPQSAVDQMDQMTDRMGENITYMDGLDKPSYIVPPQAPSDWWRIIDALSLQIDDILGVHDVSRGSAPANIESGYGLSVLAEQDSTPLGKMTKSAVAAFSELGSSVLQLYESEVKSAKRTSVVRIPGQPPQTASWTGKDLAGQTLAVVPIDAVAPRSQAAMQAFAEKALQMGLITTIQQFTRLAETPGARDMIDSVAPDVARARRENHAMALGRVSFPEEFDNHTDHIAEHNAFRKSAAYEQLKPEWKRIFALHVQAHETLAGQEAGKMAVRSTEPGMQGAPTAEEALPVPPIAEAGLLPDQIGPAPVDTETLSQQSLGGTLKAGLAEQEVLARMNAAIGG